MSGEENVQDESIKKTSAEVEGPTLQDESVDQMSTETSTEVEGPTTKQSARVKVKVKNAGGEKSNMYLQLFNFMNVLRKLHKTWVTGRHTHIINSMLLIKCFRYLQSKHVLCTKTGTSVSTAKEMKGFWVCACTWG